MARLAGVVVEYSTYDLTDSNGRLLATECVVNPDNCCSVSGTCFPKPIQRTLYFNPASFFIEGMRNPWFGGPSQHYYQPFLGTLRQFFGNTAIEDYFPLRVDLISEPAAGEPYPVLWRWKRWLTSGYSNSPHGDPNSAGVTKTVPYFYLDVEFRITKTTDTSCSYSLVGQWHFKYDDDGIPANVYNGGFASDRHAFGASATPIAPECGAPPDFVNSIADGYNQFNPYSNYIEWDCQNSESVGEQWNPSVNALGIYPMMVLIGEPSGFELPPVRTYFTGLYTFSPTVRVTLSEATHGRTWLHGTYTLVWKYSKYYWEGVLNDGSIDLLVGLEVHLPVGKRMMHRASVRVTGANTSGTIPATHDWLAGRLQVLSMSPYKSECPQMTLYGVSPLQTLRMLVEEL